MKKNGKILGLGLACGLGLLASIPANAEESPVTINGFASAGFVTGDMEADFFSGTDIIGESATFGADNTIGIQVSADMNDKVSFTGQLLAKGVIDAYNLEAHWAYVDYHPRHDFSVRAGRLVLPIVMSSEYVDVGYAYPWIRPPSEVYSGIPMTSYSGIDILYTVNIGDSNLVFQPYVGSLPPSSTAGFEVDVQLGMGLNTSLQFEYGSVRAHVLKVNDGVIGSGGLNIGMDVQVAAIGADLEIANVVFISEYMAKEFDLTGLPGFSSVEGEAWYVTLGYRMGKFLPHITFASADSDTDQMSGLSLIQASLGGLLADPAIVASLGLDLDELALLQTDPLSAINDPAIVSKLAAGLTAEQLAELPAMVSVAEMQLPPAPFSYKQESITLGLRYDFLPRTALKFEYQEIEPQEESWGLFLQEPADDKVSLFSFAIDVTF